MEEYLAKKNVASILKDVVLQLCTAKPDNAVQFMVNFLTEKYLNGSLSETTVPSTSQHVPNHEPIQAAEGIEKEADFRSPRRPDIVHHDVTRRKLEASGEWRKLPDTSVSVSDPIGHQESPEEVSSPSVAPKIPARARERRKAICAEPLNTSTDAASLPHHPKTKDQQDRLNSALRQHIMFAHLEEEEKQTIFNSMFEVHHKAGDSIIKQGDEGDNFYVVESGECDVYINRDGKAERVATIGKDGSFGELALIYGSPRAATVTAKTDTVLWALDRNTYRQILMKSTTDKRKMYEGFLEKVPMLAEVTNWERMVVADALEPFTFKDGEVIVSEGEIGDRFYIIVDGEAEVLQNRENGPEQIATLHKSDYFGEIALLTNRPRAATVVAVGTLKCVGLDRERFNRVLGPCENILRRNMENYNRYMADKI